MGGEKFTGQDTNGNWGTVNEKGEFVGHPLTKAEQAKLLADQGLRAARTSGWAKADGDDAEASNLLDSAVTDSRKAVKVSKSIFGR